MDRLDAIQTKKQIHHAYQPQIDSTYGEQSYYLHFSKRDRSFQLKSDNGIVFNIIEVGIGTNRISWKQLCTGLTILEVKQYLKEI